MPASNIHNLQTREQVRDEASLWVAKLDRELSEDEVLELREWLDRSESHRQTLFEMARLWDDLCVLNQLSSLFPFDPIQLAREQGRQGWHRLGIAASLVLGFALGLVWLLDLPGAAAPVVATSPIQYSTGIGENRLISLADGSSVHMNTNSEIRVAYAGQFRRIELQRGEARFSVAKDPNRPFIVEAGGSAVQALGTVFNVEIVADAIEVLVTEGKVQVTHAVGTESEQVTVLPGQRASVGWQRAAKTMSIPPEIVQKELAWREGMLIFRGESLEDALYDIGRYTDKTLRVADKDAAELKIAGFFKSGDIEGLLDSLSQNLPVTYREQEGEIVISSASELPAPGLEQK